MSALAAPLLTGTVTAAISDEEVLRPNRLGWVTQHFLILRNVASQNHTIIPLARLASIEIMKTPYSGLLAVAAGVFVIGAGAFASKQGNGAAVPCVLIGAFLIAVYFGSRRANITFRTDSGGVERATGSVGEASELVHLIESARSSALGVIEEVNDFSTISSSPAKNGRNATPRVLGSSAIG